MTGLPSHHVQHGGALTEATAAPTLNNTDKRQDCVWWKDKDMSLTKYISVMDVPCSLWQQQHYPMPVILSTRERRHPQGCQNSGWNSDSAVVHSKERLWSPLEIGPTTTLPYGVAPKGLW